MKLMLIGPNPKPVTGQSIAFSALARNYPDAKIFYLNRGRSVFKAIWGAFVVSRYILAMRHRGKVVYLTISRTPLGFLRDIAFINIGKVFGSKIIVHLHGGDLLLFRDNVSRIYRSLIKGTLRKVDEAIVLCESLKDQFAWCLPPDKIKIIENFYEKPEGFEGDSIGSRNWHSNDLNVFFMSNILPSKGLFQLIDGIRNSKYLDRINITFAGGILPEGEFSQKDIEAKLAEIDVDSRICFKRVGFVSGDIKWRKLYASHVFALPTRYKAEGQPISIIEAMAAGCVILASHYRGIPDLITDQLNGVFCDPENVASITDKIEWLFENRDAMKEMSARNQFICDERFSKADYLSEIDNIIQNSI